MHDTSSPSARTNRAPFGKAVTRRAFIVGAIVAGAGLAVLRLPSWGSGKPDPSQLLDSAIASADPRLLRQLCVQYHNYPNVDVRRACAAYSGAFDDPAIRAATWAMATDADLQVRATAVRSILMRDDAGETPKIVALYRADPTVRPAVDEFVEAVGMSSLRQALRTP